MEFLGSIDSARFSAKPNLKLIVHAGYVHVLKKAREPGEKPMAAYLWETLTDGSPALKIIGAAPFSQHPTQTNRTTKTMKNATSAFTSIALLFTVLTSSALLAQAPATGQPDKSGKDVLSVPAITVASGKQAIIQVNGIEYAITPTILEGGLVQVRAVLTARSDDAGALSLDAIATTDTKTLVDRIERTLALRAFEKVVKEIYETEFEFSVQPTSSSEANEIREERLAMFYAKINGLQDCRKRLRQEILEEIGRTATR